MAATEAPADSYSKASADAKATEQSQQTPTRSHDIESQLVLTTPYSVFGTNAKRNIIALCTLAGLFSPLSAFTYFPALDYMAEDLGVTLQLMNLTITMYLVMQGVVPTILGDLADQVGRRPIYILVLAVYVGANVGLALQRNYTALLILRMLQSAGSSGTISLGVMVAADLAPSHSRGRYVGAMLFGYVTGATYFVIAGLTLLRPNSGQALGPVLGGIMAQYAGWPWIFWLLAILGGICLVLLVIFFPETCRNVVGNGSHAAGRLNQPVMPLFSPHEKNASTARDGQLNHKLRHFPNPFKCWRLLIDRHSGLVLVSNALFYLGYSCFQAALSSLLMQHYGLNALQSGLCYLVYGVASIASSFITGKVLDWDYRVTARIEGITINTTTGDDLATFPIEKARIRSSLIYAAVITLTTVAFGWAVERRTHLSVPLIITLFLGFSYTGILNACMTLNVDLHPNQSGVASTAMSLTKCIAAAIGVAVLQPLLDAIGPGWTFTLFGLLAALSFPMLIVLRAWGPTWRNCKWDCSTNST